MVDFMKADQVPDSDCVGRLHPSKGEAVNVGPRLTLDNRRINVERARLMVAAINRHGGRATNIMLPEIGNHRKHALPDDGSQQRPIADLLSRFLADYRLDQRK